MELGEKEPLIDPEVKAFVFSLVSALGGSSAGDDGGYVLGDDALAVLKDIKRWLRLYDDKLMRLDVARLLADANLVKGDLLEILAGWPTNAPEGSFRSKMALYCVDLLTILTWPIDKDEQTATLHRYLHIPYLEKAHASYKDAVLHHFSGKILQFVVRVGLPSMAQTQKERTPQEEMIIKMVLYFFRNIAMISDPEGLPIDEYENDISRSSTINALHSQGVFDFILTICSNMVEEYSTHDVEVLDILFHIVKGINVETLFMEQQELISANTKELKDLMSKEKSMHAGYARHAPSRHNRFGSMIWVKRDGERHSTVFGQKGVGDEQLGLAELDRRKTWKRPRRPVKKDLFQAPADSFEKQVTLTSVAKRRLRSFVESFLDSSFNPLFLATRRAMEREADRVLDQHIRQYFYVISWFLKAECLRRSKKGDSQVASNETESFGLVATVLNQETFVLLNRSMQKAIDGKEWRELHAEICCFSQILLTVQEMLESPLDEDQEIAENILNRIFYEQTTHDRIITLLSTYKDQGFGYLDSITELAHVFLRLLERYSKQNLDMQVRSRRRARKKQKKQQNPDYNAPADQEDREDEANDVIEAQKVTSERKFDFTKFAARFINQHSVDTFVTLLRHYRDLNPEQLKRAHRFLYRTAFKMEQSTYLFRIDIINLLNNMIKGTEALDPQNPTFREWEELVRQIFRRLVKRMQDRPALAVELLFSKMTSSTYYLEHGYDRELPKSKPRPPAELEVKPGMEHNEQIGVAVSILINQSKSDHLAWVKKVLSSSSDERRAWEDANTAMQSVEGLAGQQENSAELVSQDLREGSSNSNESPQDSHNPPSDHPQPPSIVIKPDTRDRRLQIFKDKHLRLLLQLLGFEPLCTTEEETPETSWIIPSSIPSSSLAQYQDLINQFEYDPPTYSENKTAEDFVRRKSAARNNSTAKTRRAAEEQNEGNSDSEGTSASDISELFPLGGPTLKKPLSDPSKPKRKRNRHAPDEHIDESILEARSAARKKKELERRRNIKSELFVHDSDDESDEDRDQLFFAKEDEMRRHQGKRIMEGLRSKAAKEANETRGNKGKGGKRKKRAAETAENSEESGSEADNESEERDSPAAKKRRLLSHTAGKSVNNSEDEMDNESNASRASSLPPSPVQSEKEEAEDVETTPPSSQRPSSGHENTTLSANQDDEGEVKEDEDEEMQDSDKENDGAFDDLNPRDEKSSTSQVKQRRHIRAGFVIESDSDE